MKTKRLLLALGLACLIFVGYNWCIAWVAEGSHRQRVRAILVHPPANTAIVLLGNSLMEAGGDSVALQTGWPSNPAQAKALNLALGATSPVEHCLIWDSALAHTLRPRWLVYGFFDDQLITPTRGDWSDLVGNRSIAYYFPTQAAELYAPGSLLKRWELILTQCVPVLSERSSLWTQVELIRRRLEEIGMPTQINNRFGRVADFVGPSPEATTSFEQRCQAITTTKSGFSTPIRHILQRAQDCQVRVLLVEMPMPAQHRQVFYASPSWPRLREHVEHLTREAGAIYINASEWVGDEADFADAMHLNPQGARVFSTRLAQVLGQLDSVPSADQMALAQVLAAQHTQPHNNIEVSNQPLTH